MRSAVWLSLLRIIPQELQGKLMVVTASGNEINIQIIYRMEEDVLVVRGRLAGTTDVGSVLFVPLEQIDYMGFREEIKEPEMQAMFEKYVPPPKVEQMAAAPVLVQPLAPTPITMPSVPLPTQTPTPAPMPLASSPPPPPPPAPAPAAPTPATGTPTLPGKAALLERLRRSRLGQPGSGSDSGGKPG